MTDLTTWLSARLDDRERLERGKYTYKPFDVSCPTCGANVESTAEGAGDTHTELRPCRHTLPIAEFLERFCEPNPDPFVLADIAAKRELIAEHRIEEPGTDYQHCRVCHDHQRHDAARAPCLTLRLLAAPHASEPGYLQEWRP